MLKEDRLSYLIGHGLVDELWVSDSNEDTGRRWFVSVRVQGASDDEVLCSARGRVRLWASFDKLHAFVRGLGWSGIVRVGE